MWQIRIDGKPTKGLWKDYQTFRAVLVDMVENGQIDPEAKITVHRVEGNPQTYDPDRERPFWEWDRKQLALWAWNKAIERHTKKRSRKKPRMFFVSRRRPKYRSPKFGNSRLYRN